MQHGGSTSHGNAKRQNLLRTRNATTQRGRRCRPLPIHPHIQRRIWAMVQPLEECIHHPRLGGNVNLKTSKAKTQKEWVKMGSVCIIDLPQDFFLVQFFAIEDYRHTLFKGPWLIANHYIIIQRSRPFFTLMNNTIRKIDVWVCIPGLPIELYNEQFIWHVGSKIGSMLKIDNMTSIHFRGYLQGSALKSTSTETSFRKTTW